MAGSDAIVTESKNVNIPLETQQTSLLPRPFWVGLSARRAIPLAYTAEDKETLGRPRKRHSVLVAAAQPKRCGFLHQLRSTWRSKGAAVPNVGAKPQGSCIVMAGGGDGQPDDCTSRMVNAAGTGFAAGAIGGAIKSNWGDVPVVLRNQAWPALKRTGGIMRTYGMTLGFVGLAFSAADCFAESFRGKKDPLNGVLGGVAAGAVLGTAIGKLPAAVGAAGLLAVTSLAVDMSGRKLNGSGMIDDGATPARQIYPYPQSE